MKLSMWILADKLEQYKPTVTITAGKPILTGARLYHPGMALSPTIVYVGKAEDCKFVNSAGHGVVCFNGSDVIWMDTEDAVFVLNDVLTIFDQCREWMQDLMDAVKAQKSVQHLLDLTEPMFGVPAFVIDPYGLVIAYTKSFEGDYVDDTWSEIIATKRMPLRIFKYSIRQNQNTMVSDWNGTAQIYGMSRNVIGVRFMDGKQILGELTVVEYQKTLTQGFCDLAQVFSDAVTLLMRSAERRELGTDEDIIRDVLDGKVSTSKPLKNLLQLLLPDTKTYSMVVMCNPLRTDYSANAFSINRIKGLDIPSLTSSYSGTMVSVVDYRHEAEFLKLLERVLWDSGFTLGVSLPFSAVSGFLPAYEQGLMAITCGCAASGSINHCTDYALDYMLSGFLELNSLAKELKHPALDILRSYDAENNTQLYETLYEYLSSERITVATADALYIHRNTLRYRLATIEDLTNLNLDSREVRLYLLLSFKIDQIEQEEQTSRTRN